MRTYALLLLVAAMLATMAVPGLSAPPLKIVAATLWGTPEDDDLQAVTVAPDGTLYIVGNTGAAVGDLPNGVLPKRFGQDAKKPTMGPGYQWHGHGYVAHLSADATRLLHYAEFPSGMVLLTSVAAAGQSVYVGGYAADSLEDLLKDIPGLFREYPLRKHIDQLQADNAAGKEDKIAGRPGLGRYGAPCVLRLAGDLSRIESGTYLEGWQQVWDKVRVTNFRQREKGIEGHWREFFWQPTHLAVLKSGDLVVCHDGGYFRLPKPEDKQIAGGDDKLAERLLFYDCCDHVSRLSPDLARRVWKQDIYTPPVNPQVARQVKQGWPLPHYSNPRTHRMRLDKNEIMYLCGWSASATSKEPWWAPYLITLDPNDGRVVMKAYEYDPMSGRDNRMGGTVADTAVTCVAPAEDGSLLVGLLADGGNTVMGFSPKADGSPFETAAKGEAFPVKLVHWWGQIHRVDGRTRQGLGRARIGPWGWAVDLAPLPGQKVLALGRCNGPFKVTEDAWCSESPIDNPIAFLRVYSPDFDLLFSTLIPGIVPFEVARLGPARFAIAARAEQVLPPLRNPLVQKSPGKSDGYLLIVEYVGE